jgi:calcyphosin
VAAHCVQFKKGMRETGVKLEEEYCQALFRFFDGDCSGYVSFDEFMVGVRPTMNEQRTALVKDVFASMDVNNDGALTVQDVSGKYDCSVHPDVRINQASSAVRWCIWGEDIASQMPREA